MGGGWTYSKQSRRGYKHKLNRQYNFFKALCATEFPYKNMSVKISGEATYMENFTYIYITIRCT